MNLFFSVVVPVYNVAQYLEECVNSILSQSFTDFELILVDDGSKDNSGSICDTFADQDSRVRVIHKENGGQSTARNVGVNIAAGKYIIFLDSDDFFDKPDVFARLYKALNDGADVAIFRYYKYYSPTRKNDCGITLKDINFKTKGDLFVQLVSRDAFFCSCWSKCVSAKLLQDNNIRFDEDLRCEDMDWYYSVVSVANRYVVLDEPFVNYRQRENSVTSAFNPKSIYDYVITIEKWYPKLKAIEDQTTQQALLSSLAKLYCNLLIAYMRNAKQLTDIKRRIFAFKELLTYQMNPRTRIIGHFARFFGMELTIVALRIMDKVKK